LEPIDICFAWRAEERMKNYSINIRTDSHIAETLNVERDNLTGLRVEMTRFVGKLFRPC
jgi:hypothetical protein